MRSLRKLASAGLLLLGGCSSTGVGNPAPVSLSLSIVDDTQAQDAAQDLPKASIQDALVVLGELGFQPCDVALGTAYTAPGPFIVDLKAGTTSPDLPVIPGTPGGYCGIDAPLAPTKNAGLVGRSLFFDGYRADGTFFMVYANMKGTLRLRATPGANWLGLETPPAFFWVFRPRRWIAKSELDSADVTPDVTHGQAIVIDADRHTAWFLAIRARLAGLSTLYEDANGDGTFDDSDRLNIVGQGLSDAN